MKGIIFTEFLEMVEQGYGWDVVDEIIIQSYLPNDGAYTAVGTYPYEQLITLVQSLSQKVDVSVAELLIVYGRFLFGRFFVSYRHFFDNIDNSFQFIQQIDNYIHVEVRKLYPDAELPQFTYNTISPSTLEVIYCSERPFADFAQGLLQGCIDHFSEQVILLRQNVGKEPGTHAKFILTKR